MATKPSSPPPAPHSALSAAGKAQRAASAYVRTRQKIVTSSALGQANSPFAMAYLRFLSRVAQAEAHEPGPDQQTLDPNEKAIMELAILRWAQQSPLTVRQAIGHAYLGSPATLHKRLKQLRQKNYLKLEDVAGDRRAKFLVPGPNGLAYLNNMGRHILGARRDKPTEVAQD